MSQFDTLSIILAVFVLAIVAMLGYIFLEKSSGVLGNNGFDTTKIDQLKTSFAFFDYMIIFLFFALMIAAIISAYFIKSHPLYAIAGLLYLIVSVLLTPSIANMMIKFVELPIMVSILASFPYTIVLFENLPVISLIMAVLLMFASYGKREDIYAGGGGY